jgi:transcriptional regulator with XRE-family HTH domain
MAELLGCSASTVHSVESGRLKLSDSLALRMSLVTGVNVDWLLRGDTSKPPTSFHHHPYSRSEFEDWQLSKTKWPRLTKTQRAIDIVACFAELHAILESAYKRGRGDYEMARQEVLVAIKELRARFGELGRFAHLYPYFDRYNREAIKVAERAIAHARAFIAARERTAKRDRQSPKRRRSKRSFGRRTKERSTNKR